MWHLLRLITLVMLIMAIQACAYYTAPYGVYPPSVDVNVVYPTPRVIPVPHYTPRYIVPVPVPRYYNSPQYHHHGWHRFH